MTTATTPTLFVLPGSRVRRGPASVRQWRIVARITVADFEARGLHNVADMMRAEGRDAILHAYRGRNGTRLHLIREYAADLIEVGRRGYIYEQTI